MLEEIYSAGNPKGFEQVHVESIVKKYISLDDSQENVIQKLKNNGFKNIFHESNTILGARHDNGNPYFNSDARSIVIIFDFSDDLKLKDIDAVLIKSQ